MKKYIAIAVSLALVAACSIGVFAVVNKNHNTDPKDVVAAMDGVGREFLKSNAAPDKKAGDKFAAVFDKNDSTSWTAEKSKGAYIQQDFDKATSINAVVLKEVGNTVRKFHIEAWNGKEWVNVYSNDLIESFHQCIFEKPVMTKSLRVVIDKTAGDNAKISTMDAFYQAPMKLENEFINMAYMTDCSYYHKWDPVEPAKMDKFTDVTVIGNWAFDKNGKFQLVKPKDGSGGFERAVDPFSEEGKAMSERMFSEVRSYSKEKMPNIWLSITCLKETTNADGTPAMGAPGGQTDIFLNDDIRAKFIEDVIKYAKEYNIYGIDIDWEYPVTASQWQAYGKLIEDFAVALHEAGLYVSTAQSRGTGLTPAQLNLFDRINIMSYDNVDGVDGQHSTFEVSVNRTLKQFINEYGIDRSKIVLGLPWYADKLGNANIQSGWKDMIPLLMLVSEDGVHIDKGINAISSWGFNGPNLLRDKTVYAIQNQIGGVFCWQVKNDVPYNDPNSLCKTVNDTIDQFTYVKK